MKTQNDRELDVRVAGGGTVRVRTPYMTPVSKGIPVGGKRRGRGERGPSGRGLYPVLAALGFGARVSPYVASEAARAAALHDSYEEAVAALAGQGLDLDVNTVRALAHRFADAGLTAREAGAFGDRTTLAGKRVVVGIDGGRIRYRLTKKGRRRASGHHGYQAPWREPKIITVYTVDAKGRQTAERPIYEGTLAPWEDAFEIFISVLQRYGADEADVLLVAADGSNAIWDRHDELIAHLGIDPSRVHECVDFYHAVERLDEAGKASDILTSEDARHAWRRQQVRHLQKGRIDRVVSAIASLFPGDEPKQTQYSDYFRKRASRMQYDRLRAAGLPIGSGGAESAIRRIVNLRLKSTGTFWTPANAERLLHLRCWLKSGRWSELEPAYHASTLSPTSATRPTILSRVMK